MCPTSSAILGPLFPSTNGGEDSLSLNSALPSCLATPGKALPDQPTYPAVLPIWIATLLLNPKGLLLLFLFPNFFKSHPEIPIAHVTLRRRAFRLAFLAGFWPSQLVTFSKSRTGVQVLGSFPTMHIFFFRRCLCNHFFCFLFFCSKFWPELALTFPINSPIFFFMPRSCLSDLFFCNSAAAWNIWKI